MSFAPSDMGLLCLNDLFFYYEFQVISIFFLLQCPAFTILRYNWPCHNTRMWLLLMKCWNCHKHYWDTKCSYANPWYLVCHWNDTCNWYLKDSNSLQISNTSMKSRRSFLCLQIQWLGHGMHILNGKGIQLRWVLRDVQWLVYVYTPRARVQLGDKCITIVQCY